LIFNIGIAARVRWYWTRHPRHFYIHPRFNGQGAVTSMRPEPL
jgi:hypothetical protein